MSNNVSLNFCNGKFIYCEGRCRANKSENSVATLITDEAIAAAVGKVNNTNKTGWISVEEKLPPQDQSKSKTMKWRSIRVLCACKQKNGNLIVKEGFCTNSEDQISWNVSGTSNEVTHWAYLPEPPASL